MKYGLMALMMVMPGMASALSCMPPSPQLSLEFAQDDQDTSQQVVVAQVQIVKVPEISLESIKEAWMSRGHQAMSGTSPFLPSLEEPTKFSMTVLADPIAGVGVGGVPYLPDMEGPISVDVEQQCFGEWCGGLPDVFFTQGAEATVVMSRPVVVDVPSDFEWTVKLNPCGGSLFETLSVQEIEELKETFGK